MILLIERVGIWGSSMGGAHVVTIGGTDVTSRVKCIVSQVGMMRTSDLLRHAGVEVSSIAKLASNTAAGGGVGRYTGSLPELDGQINLARMRDYVAKDYAEKIKVPTLVLDAANEELWDRTENGQAVFETIRANGVECEYVLLPDSKHYGAYESVGYHKGQQEAVRWFQKHLMTQAERSAESSTTGSKSRL